MTKRVDLTVDNCTLCHATNTFVYTGDDAEGYIFTNTVCIDCEEKAEAMMSQPERLQTLCRWTMNDKR